MIRNKLIRGTLAVGTLLGSVLMTTGCSNDKNIIEEYNPVTQGEVDEYGSVPYMGDIEETVEIEESDSKSEESDSKSEGNELNIEETVCDYGVIELIEPEVSLDINPEELGKTICVYGPPEFFDSDDGK